MKELVALRIQNRLFGIIWVLNQTSQMGSEEGCRRLQPLNEQTGGVTYAIK